MRNLSKIDHRVMWLADDTLKMMGMKSAIMKLPSGTQAMLVVGTNEDGWEHVSVSIPDSGRKMPTWEEMCEVKGNI